MQTGRGRKKKYIDSGEAEKGGGGLEEIPPHFLKSTTNKGEQIGFRDMEASN